MLNGSTLATEVELLSDFVPTAEEAQQFLLASLVEELSAAVLQELGAEQIGNLRRLHRSIDGCLNALEGLSQARQPDVRVKASRARRAVPAVLIVEDEGLVAFSMRETMADAGYSAETVPSLARAWARLAQGLPDLALLDVTVLDGDSYDLAKFLMAHGVAVAFVTGNKTLPPEFGRVPCLLKPFGRKELLNLVASVRIADVQVR